MTHGKYGPCPKTGKVEGIVKKDSLLRRILVMMLVCILGVTLLTGCEQKNGREDTSVEDEDDADDEDDDSDDGDDQDDNSDDIKPDDQDGTNVVDEKATKADAAIGEWVIVYNKYHSEYGSEEPYDDITMAEDEAIDSFISIRKEDGKLIADYKYAAYEACDRILGNEVVVKDEAAYEGCENGDWCFEFFNAFEDDYVSPRFTMIDDETLIAVNEWEDGEPGDEQYYHSISTCVYLRKDSPKLENMEDLRYFNTVTVSDAKSLLESIDDNTKILLEPGVYDLSDIDVSSIQNEHILDREESESWRNITIAYVSDFCIEAKDGGEVLICIDDPYEPVMWFSSVGACTLRGVTVGHDVEPGYCSGSVIGFDYSSRVKIDNCKLYGSGTYGIEGNGNYRMEVVNSEIYDCTYGLISMSDSYDMHFNNTSFHDCREFNMIGAYGNGDYYFDGCTFKDNVVDGYSSYFVNMGEYVNITFTDCTFENNSYDKFANHKVKQINCRINDNGI